MAKLGLRQVLGSILVWVLFAPVILATGSKSFRLAIYDGTVLGVPTFLFMVLALLVFLMAFMWVLASATFDDADDKAEALAGDDQ